MSRRVLITGAAGTIGTILEKYLKEYELTLIDKNPIQSNLIQIDVAREYEKLKKISKNHDVIIHLAWDERENIRSKKTIPENKIMVENVYKAALEANVPRVVMASSIDIVGKYIDWRKPPYSFIAQRQFNKINKLPLITIDMPPNPDSPYAATKAYIESLGKDYSKRGLSVICIRFGGVNLQDTPLVDEIGYHSVWLSGRDCASLVKRCIEVKNIPNFLIVFGISNNTYRIHDISNPLCWAPKDNAENFFNV